jgi:hypothetical protein
LKLNTYIVANNTKPKEYIEDKKPQGRPISTIKLHEAPSLHKTNKKAISSHDN